MQQIKNHIYLWKKSGKRKVRLKGWLLQLERIVKYHLNMRSMKRHLVICGIPRSGTTLLYRMFIYCTAKTVTWPKEMCALTPQVIKAKGKWIISKDPNDLLVADRIKEVLHNVQFIATWRDPREALASRLHGKYWITPRDYLQWYKEIVRRKDDPDFKIIKFKQLVENPESVQKTTEGLGIDVDHPFREYHNRSPKKDQFNMPLRPLDTAPFDKWRKPEHKPHIQSILRKYPILEKIAKIYQCGRQPEIPKIS